MRLRTASILAVTGLLLAATAPAALAADRTERVSVSSAEAQGNGLSFAEAISVDGRFVAFGSAASNLVPGDTNGEFDVFVRDRRAGRTERVSLRTGGGQADGGSSAPRLSADGRLVAFKSDATNLVPGDTNGRGDIFVHDRATGRTERVSVGRRGAQANGDSIGFLSLSPDGRFVAFSSTDTNLVPGDTNGFVDVFLHDRRTGRTELVTKGRAGAQSDGQSYVLGGAFSADNRYLAFESEATNLVPGDTNGARDVFLHDRRTGRTKRVSVGPGAAEADGASSNESISADGRYLAFQSEATNLVPGDTNSAHDIFIRDLRTGENTRISEGFDGAQGDDFSIQPRISPDGRFVAFKSDATNLVPGDTNGLRDVFMHDRRTGETERVNVGPRGVQANGADDITAQLAISAEGRFVVFSSGATNLVRGDTNGTQDAFVRVSDRDE